ncbi:MAG: ergothioneine biosynthesis protein EgtB [Betaproteobacteria bacterium]|nr:ergothioneine biosynthesis protein EgtB [Betaproteobacteria bacterium]
MPGKLAQLKPACTSPAAPANTTPAPDWCGRYREVRQASVALAEDLTPEDCALQSMPDASPIKWHLAHTSWFFETFVLEQTQPGYRHFHPQYRVLFNSYYVAVGERHPRPERGLISRPSLDDIQRYRVHVDLAMQRVLQKTASLDPALLGLITLGLHHEQQHQELMLTDLKHLLSRNPLKPAYRPLHPTVGHAATALSWIHYPAREHHIGVNAAPGEFIFDNESPRHRVFNEGYALASRLVTNGEYLAFIADGGYTRAELWLSEGWDVAQAQRWQAPLYWEKPGADWQHFTLAGMQDIDPAAPVYHVSYFEADAYARRAQARLPSEAEWEAAAAHCPLDGNFAEYNNLRALAATPGAHHTPQQLYGDVWEWTQSAYAPYPGYRAAPGAVGEYNGKFMVNQYVLRGGSFATPRSHIRASYRNFFPAAARWRFSGIRLARP